jgi:hypothetical protein
MSKKYEVIYSIHVEVYADDEEQAHERADMEMDELVQSVKDDPLYINCELHRYPRTINEVVTTNQ